MIISALLCISSVYAASVFRRNDLHCPANPGDMYEYSTRIGLGAHGEVYRAMEISTGEIHALKLPLKADDDNIIREINNQMEIMKWGLDEDVPIALAKCFSKENTPWISYEILDRDLCELSLGEHMNYERIRSIGRDILTAMAIIHEKGFVIRDIKPENIMITCTDTPRAKIIDLGFMSTPDELQHIGTLAFMSPESLLTGLVGTDNFRVDAKADMWSFAITLYFIRTRRFLFHDMHGKASRSYILRQITNQLADEIKSDTSISEEQRQIGVMFMSESVRNGMRTSTLASRLICNLEGEYDDCMKFRDLLLQLLRFSSSGRLDAKEALEHPFFN